MDRRIPTYRELEAAKIIETVEALKRRIGERFPGSGLSNVAAELLAVARETVERTRWIQKPQLALRLAASVLSLSIIALLVGLLLHIRQFQMGDFVNFAQGLDASISSVVFIGAAILFLVSCETRIKRARALKAIHELRALAHIVDMHQLTKDPESCFRPALRTPTSPKRTLTPFELNRYLDYCGEMMSLISKIAALYVQGFQDAVLLDAVDDIEDLTAGFTRKIWQKITILEALGRLAPSGLPPNTSPANAAPIS